MCFKFLCFRHCPIPDPDPGSQLREDLIDLANQKFDHAGSSGSADYLFWKILKAEVHTHAAALKSNKKNYFHQNGLLIFFASLLGGTEKHRVLFSGIPLALASILTMFIQELQENYRYISFIIPVANILQNVSKWAAKRLNSTV